MAEQLRPKKSQRKKSTTQKTSPEVIQDTKVFTEETSSDEISVEALKTTPFPTNPSGSAKSIPAETAQDITTLPPFPKETHTSESPTSPQKEVLPQYNRDDSDPLKRLEAEFELLSPLEKDVVEIAKTILKKKKYPATLDMERVEMMSPLVEQLYAKCIARLKYTKGHSKEEIFSTIQSLKKKQWIVTDQRRTRREILSSPILTKVIQFIHDHPGTHARDERITKEIGITRNPFIKHIIVLDAFGLIRTKKIGRTQNYFIKNVPEIFDDFVVLFHNPLVTNIIRLLKQEENIGLSEIARRLDVYHGAIQYHIKTLVRMNIIFKQEKHFHVNSELLVRYNSIFKDPPF
jgi:DNA-binding transcriptional ArsR family regulator